VTGARTGVAWRLTAGWTARSRARRYELFLSHIRPQPGESILDVGIIDSSWRSSNPLEASYPYPSRITAVSLDDAPAFRAAHPEVEVIIADGRDLPFADGAFDIGFSNAVIEHVGNRQQQKRFAEELVRTCRRVMIATPNARFPIDPHTLLPFVHWLPRGPRHRLLRLTGNGGWASEERLNPLNAGQLRGFFPPDATVKIVRQRVLGLTTVLVAVAERRDHPGQESSSQ
jgi:hypothetical protein